MREPRDRLRRAAEHLKRDYRSGDATARDRVRAVLGPQAAVDGLRHADALHVIAREHGHGSWPRLMLAAELASMDRAARAARLQRALFFGQHWRTRDLLAADPAVARDNLGLMVALYDQAGVAAVLATDPAAATRPIGPRRPILHLAFSQHIHAAPQQRDAMLAIAAAMVAAGADVNDGYPAEPDSDHMLSALYGALCHADNRDLAAWLLDRGADPNDNESLYHATELGHCDGLKLLLRHGVATRGGNALPRALDFGDLEAVRLLLDAGADPNEGIAPHPSDQPPAVIPALHQAARRMCSAEIARLLIDRGADGRASYAGHSAYAFARMRGNHGIARVLEEAGQATSLDASEALIAAAADGPADGMVDPALLTGEARRIMGRVLGQGDAPLAHVRRLLDIGIDPDWTDEMAMPAIHIAGWEGHADVVAWLLRFDPDLTTRNAYGGDLLGTIIHGAEFSPNRDRRDHIGCARAALERGARLRTAAIEASGVEALAAFLQDWADDHPDQVDR